MTIESQRWEIGDDDRRDVVQELMRIIRSDAVETAEKLTAIGRLKDLEAQNQRDERDNDPTKRIAGLLALAKQFGIDPPAPGRIEGGADSHSDGTAT